MYCKSTFFEYINESYMSNDHEYKLWKRRNVTIRGIKEVGKANGVYGSFGDGLYTAFLSNTKLAKQYGEVYYIVGAIPKNPLIVNTVNDAEIKIQQLIINYCKLNGADTYYDKKFFEKHTSIEKEMQKLGYDGLIIKGREMVNYNPPDDIKYYRFEEGLYDYYIRFVKNKINESFFNYNDDSLLTKSYIENFIKNDSVIDDIIPSYGNIVHVENEDELEKLKGSVKFFNYIKDILYNELDAVKSNIYEKIDEHGNIKIYREMKVFSDYLEQLQKFGKHIGIYWSWDELAVYSHNATTTKFKNIVLIESEINEKYVNWDETFKLNIHPYYTDEKEIRLFKNTPIRILSIKLNGKELDISSIQNKTFYA